MNKKNIKILIIIILSCILFTVFYKVEFKLVYDEVKETKINQNDTKNIKVYLNIQDKKYEGEFKEGESVFGVMQKVKEGNKDFDFKYEEHTGLGIFIKEINGKEGGRNGYWIYSVNGVEASIGVSNYKIKDGDVISWKYEK